MADRQETTADVIAWLRRPREGENAYLTVWRDEIADRLEAALKRERGDCAKLREAMKQVNELNDLWFDTFTLPDGATSIHDEIEDVISAALAAPARNCDKYASAEEAWDAYDEWVESYRAQGKTEPFNEFGWLFAPATEKEGGNDGK